MDQYKNCLFARNKNDLMVCQCAILKFNWRELWRTVFPFLRIDPYECPHKIITYEHQRCKDAERNYIHEKPKGNE